MKTTPIFPLLILSLLGMAHLSTAQVYVEARTIAELGIQFQAQENHSITDQDGGIYIIARTSYDPAASDMAIVVVPAPNTSLDELAMVVGSGMHEQGVDLNPAGGFEKSPSSIGVFLSGTINGMPAVGYMKARMGSYGHGIVMIGFYYLVSNVDFTFILKGAVNTHMDWVKFTPPASAAAPATAYQQGSSSSGSIFCSCCAGNGTTGCALCNGTGQKTETLTRYQGDRTIYETVTKSCTYCFGKGKQTCVCCNGSGRNK